MKKQLLILLVAGVVAGMLAGCAPKGEAAAVVGEEKHEEVSSLVSSLAEPVEEVEPEVVELPPFLWRGHTMVVLYVQDDGTLSSGTIEAEGRLVKVYISCTDGTLTWDEMKAYSDFVLIDNSGNRYVAKVTGFRAAPGGGTKIEDLQNSEYIEISPMFDLPEDVSLDDCTLVVKTDESDEMVKLPLKGVAQKTEDDSSVSIPSSVQSA